MRRREFLGLLGALAVAPAFTYAPPRTQAEWVPEMNRYAFQTADGARYRMVRVHQTVQAGNLLFNGMAVLGVATCRIDAGNFGLVQVAGPTTVRYV